MNESKFSQKYEDRIKKIYSELGTENKDSLDIWGNAIYKGEIVNIYTNTELIKEIFTNQIIDNEIDKKKPLKIVDFGSSEGYVIATTTSQLQEQGYTIIPVAIDINKQNLVLLRKKYPDIETIEADLLDLPLKKNSVDGGILRFTLPYFGKEKQSLVLEQIYNALVPQGKLCIFHDGGFSSKLGELYNEFFADATAAMGSWNLKQVKENRYFISSEELRQKAQNIGFGTFFSKDWTKKIISFLSPDSYASRFNMNKEQLDTLYKIFEKWKKKDILPFDKDSLRLRRSMYSCILGK